MTRVTSMPSVLSKPDMSSAHTGTIELHDVQRPSALSTKTESLVASIEFPSSFFKEENCAPQGFLKVETDFWFPNGHHPIHGAQNDRLQEDVTGGKMKLTVTLLSATVSRLTSQRHCSLQQPVGPSPNSCTRRIRSCSNPSNGSVHGQSRMVHVSRFMEETFSRWISFTQKLHLLKKELLVFSMNCTRIVDLSPTQERLLNGHSFTSMEQSFFWRET